MALWRVFFFWIFTTLVGCAESVIGRVVAVSDGDTLTILTPGKQQIRVRLKGIDAPESRQAFGNVAKRHLSDMVYGQDVRIEASEYDTYGRLLGDVFVGTKWVNVYMVADGLAWHYTRYSQHPSLAKAERDARSAQKGLWSAPSPVPPWQWRRSR